MLRNTVVLLKQCFLLPPGGAADKMLKKKGGLNKFVRFGHRNVLSLVQFLDKNHLFAPVYINTIQKGSKSLSVINICILYDYIYNYVA